MKESTRWCYFPYSH